MRRFARFGTVCTIQRTWKTPPWVSFTFFILYKCYQIAQSPHVFNKYFQQFSIHSIVLVLLGDFNALSADSTKWSNTLKQFVGCYPTNCFSVFDHFVELALKGLKESAYAKVKEITSRLKRITHFKFWKKYSYLAFKILFTVSSLQRLYYLH